jgi:hypothetical protein
MQVNGGHFFDSTRVETLIADYKLTGSRQILGQIVQECRPVALSLIRSKCTFAYECEDDLISAIDGKLCRSVGRYDPARGRAFSFITRLSINMLATNVTHQKKHASRYQAINDVIIETTPDDAAPHQTAVALADLEHKIFGIRSAVSAANERECQKWYVQSFIDAGFQLRRHECADAAMKVYDLSHRRSRQLYDLTLLEIRRETWDETTHERPRDLRGTKGLPLLRYSNYLSKPEWPRFIGLMRDLAPYLVVLVKPDNERGIRAGTWSAVRQNLEWILYGIPNATPLFASR